MTSPQTRINLLRKSEQRYQGAVSRRFVLMVAVGAPILIVSILSGIKAIQYTGVQADLKQSQEIWKELEPRLELYKEENRGLAYNKQAMDLINGWKSSQTSFVTLLEEVQDTVPANIQFTRLSVKSEQTPLVYTASKDMELKFSLVIDGAAQGDTAESQVIELGRDLMGAELVESTFDSIKLASLRKRNSTEGESIREFRLVSEALEGGKL